PHGRGHDHVAERRRARRDGHGDRPADVRQRRRDALGPDHDRRRRRSRPGTPRWRDEPTDGDRRRHGGPVGGRRAHARVGTRRLRPPPPLPGGAGVNVRRLAVATGALLTAAACMLTVAVSSRAAWTDPAHFTAGALGGDWTPDLGAFECYSVDYEYPDAQCEVVPVTFLDAPDFYALQFAVTTAQAE